TVSMQMAAGCGSWGKQHSGASLACIWQAVRRLDVHSLMRQNHSSFLSLMRSREWPLPRVRRMSKVRVRRSAYSFSAQPATAHDSPLQRPSCLSFPAQLHHASPMIS
ncbi:MAG: hypothetical protein SGPRY_005951, partial [Prymnesium sp.]